MKPTNALLLTTLLLSGLLTSCGDKNTGTVVANNQPTPLKIMLIGQITDTANSTSTPEAAAGARAAVTSINQQGGILGRPLQLIVCDEKADANEAAKCARKAIRENVIATVGNTTNHGNLVLAALEKGRIASIGHNPISARDFASPVAFPVQGGSPVAVTGTVKLLIDMGARNIRLATVDSRAGALSEGFITKALEGSEARLVGTTLIPIGSPDYASYANTLIEDSDGIIISTNSDQAARIIVALRQAGVNQMIAMPGIALPPATIKQLGDNAQGIYVASNFRPLSSPSLSKDQYLKDMAASEAKAKLNNFSMQSWLAVYMLKKSIESDNKYQNGTAINAENILATLNQLSNLDMGDLTPSYTTTSTRTAPFDRLFINQVLYGRVNHGQVELIDELWHSTAIE